MKAEILKINWGLFYVFPEVALLGAGKHCAKEILSVIAKSGHQISKAKDTTEEWQRYKFCS